MLSVSFATFVYKLSVQTFCPQYRPVLPIGSAFFVLDPPVKENYKNDVVLDAAMAVESVIELLEFP
jgi:hypothetical protein